jgi:hypothetical protein
MHAVVDGLRFHAPVEKPELFTRMLLAFLAGVDLSR